jgi:hypothetical protein
MASKTFVATVIGKCFAVYINIPFDPNEAWGAKQRHDVTGTINGNTIRGPLISDNGEYFLSLGPAWRRDNNLDIGDSVTVVLDAEGPQLDNLPPDVAAALTAEPTALEFFGSIATFYRKNYMRWIESAKRPETRAARITEMIALLKAGKREK